MSFPFASRSANGSRSRILLRDPFVAPAPTLQMIVKLLDASPLVWRPINQGLSMLLVRRSLATRIAHELQVLLGISQKWREMDPGEGPPSVPRTDNPARRSRPPCSVVAPREPRTKRVPGCPWTLAGPATRRHSPVPPSIACVVASFRRLALPHCETVNPPSPRRRRPGTGGRVPGPASGDSGRRGLQWPASGVTRTSGTTSRRRPRRCSRYPSAPDPSGPTRSGCLRTDGS